MMDKKKMAKKPMKKLTAKHAAMFGPANAMMKMKSKTAKKMAPKFTPPGMEEDDEEY